MPKIIRQKKIRKRKNPVDLLRKQMLKIIEGDRKHEEMKNKYEESWKKQMRRTLAAYGKRSLRYKGRQLSIYDVKAFRSRENMKDELYSLKKLIMDTGYLLNIDVEDLLDVYKGIRKHLNDLDQPAPKRKKAPESDIFKELYIEDLKNKIVQADTEAKLILNMPPPITSITNHESSERKPPTPPQIHTSPLPRSEYGTKNAEEITSTIFKRYGSCEGYAYDDVSGHEPGVYDLVGWILENEHRQFNPKIGDSELKTLRSLFGDIDAHLYGKGTACSTIHNAPTVYKRKAMVFEGEKGKVGIPQALANKDGIKTGQQVRLVYSELNKTSVREAVVLPDRIKISCNYEGMIKEEWRWDAISLNIDEDNFVYTGHGFKREDVLNSYLFTPVGIEKI